MAGTLKGDAPGLDAGLYAKPITLADAQTMVDLLVREFRPRLPKVTIVGGRKTVRLWGRAFTRRENPRDIFSPRRYFIRLHPKGLNEGTVLHELAHHLAKVGGHGSAFKNAQRTLVWTWRNA